MEECIKCNGKNIIKNEKGYFCCDCGWDSETGTYIGKRTRADRIRYMSDEELAEFIISNCDNPISETNEDMCDICNKNQNEKCDRESCKKAIAKWLKQEADDQDVCKGCAYEESGYQSFPCRDCRRRETRDYYQKKNNAQEIQQMSYEELADFLYKVAMYNDVIPYCKEHGECDELYEKDEDIPKEMCMRCMMEWLKQEAKEKQNGKRRDEQRKSDILHEKSEHKSAR